MTLLESYLLAVPFLDDIIFFKTLIQSRLARRKTIKKAPHLQLLPDAQEKLANIKPNQYNYDCYIISPGASIARLSSCEKEIIERGFVVTFNSSCFFEIKSDLSFQETSNNSSYTQGLHECLQFKINQGLISPDSIILKNAWKTSGHLVDNAQVSPIVNYPKKPYLLMDDFFPHFAVSESCAKKIFTKYLFYDRSSYFNAISSLVIIALVISQLGFKNIYFIGTDLINSCHFYKIPNSVNESLSPFLQKLENKVASIHATAQGDFSVVEALQLILSFLKKINPELQFWSPHKASPLCKFFPIQKKLSDYGGISAHDLQLILEQIQNES
ncbi:hypothetical protein AWQ23_02205 [Picosynechococcus sp. PCC 73109]|nr:hypothetical protein AWQ23_02205 [Picosynechococcus sp. PCC 73109]